MLLLLLPSFVLDHLSYYARCSVDTLPYFCCLELCFHFDLLSFLGQFFSFSCSFSISFNYSVIREERSTFFYHLPLPCLKVDFKNKWVFFVLQIFCFPVIVLRFSFGLPFSRLFLHAIAIIMIIMMN